MARSHDEPSSPRLDLLPLLAGARRTWRHALETAQHPAARLHRIDHIVDLEHRGGVDRLAALVAERDASPELRLAFVGIGDRRQFLAVGQTDRALEPHAAKLAR